MNKSEQIVAFFRNHHKFPFHNWYTNYDEYCAMYLCLTNLLKSYISVEQYKDWSYAYNYIDFRRNPDGEVAYPLMCINSKIELVVYLGCIKADKNGNIETNFSVQISRDDRWGDRWETNAPQEEWYNEVAILLDFNNPVALQKIDTIFKTVFEKKITFKDLQFFEESNLNFDDE